MFWQKKQQTQLSIGCTLSQDGYSFAVVQDNKQVIFSQSSANQKNLTLSMQQLAKDIERLDLIAHDCSLILLPYQYQLILIDALNVPEAEMNSALRWNLKGLSDYDLEDVAIDTCPAPVFENEAQKKIFVAITPLSLLNEKRARFEDMFLNVTRVTIIEMALKNLLDLMYNKQTLSSETPLIIISICNTLCKLHIVYKDMFYLIRALLPNKSTNTTEPVELATLSFEIERSIDYCVNQLNLPQPRQLLVTPGFYRSMDGLEQMGKNLSLAVVPIDLNHYLDIQPPLSIEKQHEVFYSLIGALSDTSIELTQ